MTPLEHWQQLVGEMPVASSHIHHRPPEVHRGLDLARLLNDSYVGWGGRDATVAAERGEFIAQLGANTYFVWLSRAVAEIYRQGEITPENWDNISDAISEAHRDPEHHFRLLRDTCRMSFGVQDAYWNPGDDMGRPDLFKATLRINAWVMCHGPQVQDHNDNSPWQQPGFEPATLEEYLARCTAAVEAAAARGAVALKSALAYDRSLDFGNPDEDLARRAFGAAPDEATEAERRAFGDVVMHHICRVAAATGLPLQVHLGLGILAGSRPMLFEPTIAAHPETTFDLFHCGYPWVGELGGLLHNYPNTYADFCWLPLISTTAAVRALHEYLDVGFSTDRLLWGDDTGTAEEAHGARLAWEHVVSRVLHERVTAGWLTRPLAETLAEKLMYGNVEKLFGR